MEKGCELKLELVLLCWRKKGSWDDKAVRWLHKCDKDAARHVARIGGSVDAEDGRRDAGSGSALPELSRSRRGLKKGK